MTQRARHSGPDPESLGKRDPESEFRMTMVGVQDDNGWCHSGLDPESLCKREPESEFRMTRLEFRMTMVGVQDDNGWSSG